MTKTSEQLAALDELHRLLEWHEIEYWLFGGWAVDFHAGTVTRAHDDLDLAVWPAVWAGRFTRRCAMAGPPGRRAPSPRMPASCSARAHGS